MQRRPVEKKTQECKEYQRDGEMQGTAVSVAFLTTYDMCKAADRGMTINGVRSLEKRGQERGSCIRINRRILKTGKCMQSAGPGRFDTF